ncbi:hypothetical protein [Bogoriella caseilytica]|nr:hypothetical protein [Bogoriella caseilytica]
MSTSSPEPENQRGDPDRTDPQRPEPEIVSGEPEILEGAASGPSVAGQALNQLVPMLVRLARPPGLILLLAASVTVLLLGVLGWLYGSGGTQWTAWVPLALAVILAIPVVVFGMRRARLNRRTRGLQLTVRSGVTVLVKRPGEGKSAREDGSLSGIDPQREREHLEAARAELRVRQARFLPRFEAAQRAARALAGGGDHAPYLRDDLRVTLLALVGTVLAIPTATVAALITGILLGVRSAPL